MRCSRCGNENPGTNRFCGMCGATLLPTAPVPNPTGAKPGSSTQASSPPASATSAVPSPAPPLSAPHNITAPRAAAPAPEEQPVISGPSFLGLNEPAPRKRGSLSIDPASAPSSGNLDYLLEDDEPKRGGAGKFILIAVALALAVGLGYLRWKNQNFGWLSSGPSKPAAARQTSDASDSSSATPSSGTAASSSSAPAPSQPAADSMPSAASPADNPAPSTAAPNPATATDAVGSTTTPNPAAATSPPATKDSGAAAASTDTPPVAPVKRKAPPADPNLALPPVTRPAKATDPVSEAQKYLYGKGAQQDCDRGLRLLKPAADKSNPKAMVEMGALYSAGLCTPRDLPTAYRWFAMALRKEPDNQSLQTDLQKLWGEMTQPERQLAIKLSQ